MIYASSARWRIIWRVVRTSQPITNLLPAKPCYRFGKSGAICPKVTGDRYARQNAMIPGIRLAGIDVLLYHQPDAVHY